MKKLLVFLCAISLVFGMAGAASAVLVDFTYTADNVVNSWYKIDGGVVTLSTDSNAADWRFADTAILDLDMHEAYEIIWQCENSDPNTNWAINPGGFLAEISSVTQLEVSSLLSSWEWEVALVPDSLGVPVWALLEWFPATEYAANNDASSIWFSANGGGGPVSGIDDDAQWIWWDENFTAESPGPGDSVFIRVCVKPIPEPATMFLLGTGLIGLAGFTRRRFKK